MKLFSVVAMGGDGTVNKVADGLMSASQKYRDIEQKTGFTPTRARIPLGIIPIGKCHTLLHYTQSYCLTDKSKVVLDPIPHNFENI